MRKAAVSKHTGARPLRERVIGHSSLLALRTPKGASHLKTHDQLRQRQLDRQDDTCMWLKSTTKELQKYPVCFAGRAPSHAKPTADPRLGKVCFISATLDVLITPAPLPAPRDQQQHGGSRHLSRLELKSRSQENGIARVMGQADTGPQVLTKCIQMQSESTRTGQDRLNPGEEMTFSFSK